MLKGAYLFNAKYVIRVLVCFCYYNHRFCNIKIFMTHFNKEEFETLKNKVNADYKNIGTIYCPVLKLDIIFNANGFHHLRYDNNRLERSKVVQFNKFRFFHDDVNCVGISTTIQEYRRVNTFLDANKFLVEWFAFLSIFIQTELSLTSTFLI